jgi:hypothetical protein
MPLPKPTGTDKSAFMQKCMQDKHVQNDFKTNPQKVAVCESLWRRKKAKASLAMNVNGDEVIFGETELSEDEIIAAEDEVAVDMEPALDEEGGTAQAADKSKEPYGDVTYGDPGYQKDGKKRYPLNTPEHIRAAWNYIHQEKNAAKYTPAQVSKIKSRIVSAWKSKIDPKGPPSAKS